MGCGKTSFLLFANAQGARTLLTAKCPAPRTQHTTNAQGLLGGVGGGVGMLTAEIGSHIITKCKPFYSTPVLCSVRCVRKASSGF